MTITVSRDYLIEEINRAVQSVLPQMNIDCDTRGYVADMVDEMEFHSDVEFEADDEDKQ